MTKGESTQKNSMLSVNPPLTKNDFINSSWQEVINASEKKECFAYSQGFLIKAKEAEEAGNIREKVLFFILGSITFAEINSESNEEHFAKIFENLLDEYLDFLAEIATEITDPELQARVTDILWCKRRNYQMAQLAVPAYIQSAIELENSARWVRCFTRIERAFRLARKINYQVETVVQHIETVLERYNGEDPRWLSARLMELLQEYRLVDSRKYANLAEKAATVAESVGDWITARDYWEIKAKWHHLEKDKDKERVALRLAAEIYIKEAENAVKNSPTPYLAASNFLERAIEAFRKIPGTKEEKEQEKKRVDEVHKLLLQYQQKSMKELVTIQSERIDFSKEVEKVRASVRGKKLQDALFALALLATPPKVSQLRQQADQIAKDAPLFSLISKVKHNEMGKVVARQSGKTEEETKFEMYTNAAYYQSIQARVLIEPARDQINLEHPIQVKDLLPIVANSPFVPPDRQYLFAKGLYAGLTGDFFTSTHILIPQIENSIRYLLWKKGVLPSSYDDQGIQNEHNLNTTLYYPETASIFDEDTLFDLKGLLVEHSGSNLRNRMAHGLINDDGFLSPLMSYLWWLTLRLCCLPMIIYQQKVEQSNPWVKFAGMFKDDPLFDEFVEEMAAYRRELDAEINTDEGNSEEK
ncbi:DUF4209 domain-containing protein [Limnoraphis robusta]|uniref:DUF4209 domain-containing protein n=1 Tax=Limnoraphis robusta TaxID=1118279 RepID=UPI002B1F82D1|nr:DUF4209 domain-containing protein [Limnoraphis robusta]MEA5496757.1 DUF4209 domain-containing protein [Limnoraphis robusta BA-68 BA1]